MSPADRPPTFTVYPRTPIEQINAKEEAQYLHHDQAGSTRLITGEKGETIGAYTYDAYGNTTGHTGTATTPLGYDAQYTSPDTGLIYLRARVYDPATAQFRTHEGYAYAQDNPLAYDDPTGESIFGEFMELAENLNPIKYYEAEINAYEKGCSYWQSIQIGFRGAGSAATIIGMLDGGEGDVADEPATTPDGRPYSNHYLEERGPERNIPGSVVDETIEHGEVVEELPDRTVYYDPKNNVTVILSKTTGKIITARKGSP